MIKVRDLEMLHDIDIIYENRIVLYGTGDYGRRSFRILSQLGIPIYAVFDSNRKIWGKKFKGHKILSVQDIEEICKDEKVIIIIAIANTKHIKSVLDMLDRKRLREIKCYTYFALKTSIELHIDDRRIKKVYRNNYQIGKRMFSDHILNDWENRAREFIFSLMRYDTVLIWQPGKVGSSSIAKSLEKINIQYIQLHCLGFGNWLNPQIHNSYGIQHYWKKNPIEKMDLHDSHKIKIITLVRDPIGRSIADYFEGLGTEYIKHDNTNSNIYQSIKDFLKNEAEVGEYGYIFEWFNHEIKEFFGIDIYKYDFDREKGYQIICEGNVEILLIKLEKLNQCQDVIGRFVEAENFCLLKENIGDDKTYKFAYDEVKRKIKIPESIKNFYYRQNEAMDHFYTEEEKNNFLKKWSENR